MDTKTLVHNIHTHIDYHIYVYIQSNSFYRIAITLHAGQLWKSMKAHYDMIVDLIILFATEYFTLYFEKTSYGTIKPYTFQIIWDRKCNADSVNDGIGVRTVQWS